MLRIVILADPSALCPYELYTFQNVVVRQFLPKLLLKRLQSEQLLFLATQIIHPDVFNQGDLKMGGR